MTLRGGYTTLRGYTLGSRSGATLRGRRTLGGGTNTTLRASRSSLHITLKIFLEFNTTHIYTFYYIRRIFIFINIKK
jgi:hypothetical protein